MDLEKMKLAEERITATMQKLQSASPILEQATEDLGKVMLQLEEILRGLHLGVSAWLLISATAVVERSIGYTKVKGKWGIALREIYGGKDPTENLWAFNEGPRWLRLNASAKLPELLEVILERTLQMTTEIQNRTAKVAVLVDAITPENKTCAK